MDLELDHFFILTENPKEMGDELVCFGLEKSFSRDHKGQGTSSRRFEFSNGMLELLYIRDHNEALNGAAKGLQLPQRLHGGASPFGIILTRKNVADMEMPFNGWKYQPDYFPSPNAFHIGDNSKILAEPLCIYVPFIGPVLRTEEVGLFKSISHVKMVAPISEVSEILLSLTPCERFEFETGKEHLVVLTLDKGKNNSVKDFRPGLPLIVHW